MHASTTSTLRVGIVIAAIICEIFLSNGMMILLLAVGGIAGRALVMYQEEQVKKLARDAAVTDLLIAADVLIHRRPNE
jgi:hypothetical protein